MPEADVCVVVIRYIGHQLAPICGFICSALCLIISGEDVTDDRGVQIDCIRTIWCCGILLLLSVFLPRIPLGARWEGKRLTRIHLRFSEYSSFHCLILFLAAKGSLNQL